MRLFDVHATPVGGKANGQDVRTTVLAVDEHHAAELASRTLRERHQVDKVHVTSVWPVEAGGEG